MEKEFFYTIPYIHLDVTEKEIFTPYYIHLDVPEKEFVTPYQKDLVVMEKQKNFYTILNHRLGAAKASRHLCISTLIILKLLVSNNQILPTSNI